MDSKRKALDIIARLSGKDPSTLEPGQDLVGDLGFDSPRALQLLVELEEALGIEISDDDAAKMDTVGDILDFLEKGPAVPTVPA
ncbi:MAG: acyl carrier protein [Acidobacteria bacterium]|nr:MAG: acyl carrier protein [Acidobacteriota bacterium]